MIEGSQERPHRDDAAAACRFFGTKVMGEGNQAEGKLTQRAGRMNSLSCSGIQMVYAEGVGWKMGGLEDEVGKQEGAGWWDTLMRQDQGFGLLPGGNWGPMKDETDRMTGT